MRESFEEIKVLFDSHQTISGEIAKLQSEQRGVAFELTRKLLDAQAFSCFTINWRAVHRLVTSQLS